MEPLPQSEQFVCQSNLSPDEIMKRLRTFTIVPGSLSSGKAYSGILKKYSFKISNNKPRKVYGTVLPLSPVIKFIPKFIEGNVQPYNNGSRINITFQTGNVAKGGNYFALFILIFPFIIGIAVALVFWAIGMFDNLHTAPVPPVKKGWCSYSGCLVSFLL